MMLLMLSSVGYNFRLYQPLPQLQVQSIEVGLDFSVGRLAGRYDA
jgi:hypothetical protein